MSEVHVHRVQPAWKKNALIDNDTYLRWYADSIKNPDKFWGKHGKRIDWFKPFSKVTRFLRQGHGKRFTRENERAPAQARPRLVSRPGHNVIAFDPSHGCETVSKVAASNR